MKYTKNDKDMNAHFEQQIGFIKRSMDAYDMGDEDEAQRIATIIRIFLHDTGQSKSLLKHLNLKNDMLFYTTAEQYTPANMYSYEGLLVSSSEGRYLPSCNCGDMNGFFLNFDDWWNQIVLSDITNIFTRRDLVLNVADTDGGAHIDKKLDEAYAILTKSHSLSGRVLIDGNALPFRNNPVYACIRQIASELIYSIAFHKTVLTYTRKKDAEKNGIACYIGEKVYFNLEILKDNPIFNDNRVSKTEARKCYIDELNLIKENKGRRLLLTK